MTNLPFLKTTFFTVHPIPSIGFLPLHNSFQYHESLFSGSAVLDDNLNTWEINIGTPFDQSKKPKTFSLVFSWVCWNLWTTFCTQLIDANLSWSKLSVTAITSFLTWLLLELSVQQHVVNMLKH